MTAKLTAVLIFFTCLQVAAGASGQITLKVKDAELNTVFKEIERQTGFEYDFFYPVSLMEKARAVTVDVRNVTLDEALKEILKGQPYSYIYKGTTICILLTETTKSRQLSPPLYRLNIRGRVTDLKNDPLPGVTVRAKGTTEGTITDQNGNYEIAADPDGIIVFSSIGFQTLEIKINSQSMINITMIENNNQLKETIIKGYYETTRELNTGNVSVVKSSDIEKQPVTDFVAALQGKVPGLFIQQLSGAPGRSFTVRLRGPNSIANGNDPLYIVDGVPFGSTTMSSVMVNNGASMTASPLADINPTDIESIQVLKDADATAIYGSRGANGVILITTKKGKKGKSRAEINLYAGAGKITKQFDLLNTEQYIKMRKEAFKNDNRTPGAADYDLNGTFDQSKYTNWQKQLIGHTASITDIQLAFSGGSNNTNIRLAGNYHNEGSVYAGNFSFQRGSGLVKINHETENNKLKIDFTSSYSAGSSSLPSSDLIAYILLPPNAPDIYLPNGALNFEKSSWINPMSETLKKNKETNSYLNSNATISYELIRKLVFQSSFGYLKKQFRQQQLIPYSALDPSITPNAAVSRIHQRGENEASTWQIEPQIQYSVNVGRGELDALIGSTLQVTNQKALSLTARGFASDEIMNNILAATIISITSNPSSTYRYNAAYARIGYTHGGKYVLNLTGRRDGSSRFGPGKQFGNFGALGVAWLFTKEKLIFDNLKFLSYGKLRGSIGVTGNDRLPDYQFLSTYSSYSLTYQGNNSLYPTRLTNPVFSWEKVNKIELGLELGLWENLATANLSIYRNRTANQLVGYSLPYTAGFTSVQANLPAVVQNIGLEFDGNVHIIEKQNLKFSTGFNLSIPRNKLVSFPNLKGSSFASLLAIGMPLNIKFLYTYTGLDPMTNTYSFEDINKDGSITLTNDRKPYYVGLKFFGGWNHSLTYKSFQLDLFFSYAKQNAQAFLFTGLPGSYGGGYGNQPLTAISGGYLQPFSQMGGQINDRKNLFITSNGNITDASFIRLRNLSFSWQLPQKWKTINGRLFMQCQNVFTISKYKGLDPENAQASNTYRLPPLRVITVGAKLNL